MKETDESKDPEKVKEQEQEEKQPEGNKIKREANGRFKKGQSANKATQFKTRPANAGRKKFRFREVAEKLKQQYGDPISADEIRYWIRYVLSMTVAEREDISQKKDLPRSFVAVWEAIRGDIESRSVSNFIKLLNFTFGAPKQEAEITVTQTGDTQMLETLDDEELAKIIATMQARVDAQNRQQEEKEEEGSGTKREKKK